MCAALSRTVRTLVRGLRPSTTLGGLQSCNQCIKHIHGPALPTDQELYDAVPNYPEIETFRNPDEKAEAEIKAKVKALKTVEEKQYFTNLPKYFGWRTYHMDSSKIPPAALPSVRYITNTTLVEGLPEVYYDGLEEEASAHSTELAPAIKASLAFHATQHQLGDRVKNDKVEYHEHYAISDLFKTLAFKENRPAVSAVNRLIMAKLSAASRPHLRSATLDVEPRNEAFWFRGPLDPHPRKVGMRKGVVNCKMNKNSRNPRTMEWAESQYDYPFQFLGSNIHEQVRCQKALEPVLPMDDALVKEGEVPKYDYLPQYSGWVSKRRYGTNFLASWTGSNTSFSHLVLVDNVNLLDRDSSSSAWQSHSELNERPDMLLSKVILNGFGMTYAQACNHGFSPFNDPQRPFVGQVVVTDGRRWKLGLYQLNKMAMQGISETSEEMLRNVCWHLPEQELYGEINPETGEVSDFNVDLLKTLVKMYMKEPMTSSQEIPNEGYLDVEKRHLYQLKNQYNREAFTQYHRHMMANRPRATTARYGQIQWHEELYMRRHPEIAFQVGNREMPWFVRAKYDKRGREFWHPEYRWYDNQPGHYVPRKFRGKGRQPSRAPVLTAPLPPDDDVE